MNASFGGIPFGCSAIRVARSFNNENVLMRRTIQFIAVALLSFSLAWFLQGKRAIAAAKIILIEDVNHSADVLVLLKESGGDYETQAQPILYHAFFVVIQLKSISIEFAGLNKRQLEGFCVLQSNMSIWRKRDDFLHLKVAEFLSSQNLSKTCEARQVGLSLRSPTIS